MPGVLVLCGVELLRMRSYHLTVFVAALFGGHHMSRRRFYFSTVILFSFLLCSCAAPDEPSAGPVPAPPEGGDFFPAQATGDSVQWDFIHSYTSGGVVALYFEGVLTWHVAARVNAQAGTTTTIRQVFRGFKSTPKGSPVIRDTIWLAPEETQISILENSEHQITLSNNVWGASGAGYGGPAISFPRYSVSAKDTLVFNGGVTFSTVSIHVKRTVGLLDYVWSSGAGMSAYRTTFHRR